MGIPIRLPLLKIHLYGDTVPLRAAIEPLSTYIMLVACITAADVNYDAWFSSLACME